MRINQLSQLTNHLDFQHKDFYLIGEIGVNHNGSLENAFKLIDMAKRCDIQAVKFQKRTPEVCTPLKMRDQIRETPWGEMTYLEYRKRIEFSESEYDQIDEYCNKIGIAWSASAWDEESLKFLDKYDLPFNKVASAMNLNFGFLRQVANRGKITLLSTGMSNTKDIDKMVEIFTDSGCPFILMHTTSTYPADDANLNLLAIQSMQEQYGIHVGYSGHESTTFPSQMAGVLGARVIERHITLDRAMWGTDQSASLSEIGLRELQTSLERITTILGNGIKKLEPGEDKVIERLRWWL